MTDITPIILTLNEVANIERTLAAVSWAKRIIVVDSESTDGTLELLARYPNVDVLVRPFDNLRDQWNAGLDLVETEWAMALDADHVLSPKLVREIQSLPPNPPVDGYWVRFVYMVQGRALRASLYPPKIILFRTRSGRFVQDGHTQRLLLEGRDAWLKHPGYHDDRKERSSWLSKQPHYANLEADKLLIYPSSSLSRVDRIRRTGLAPFLMPVYCLFAKGLILDGKAGLVYTYERTYAEILLSLQLLDRRLAATHV